MKQKLKIVFLPLIAILAIVILVYFPTVKNKDQKKSSLRYIESLPEQSVRTDFHDVSGYYQIAQKYQKNAQYNDAIFYYQKLLKTNPHDKKSLLGLAFIYIKQGYVKEEKEDLSGALGDYRKAIEVVSDNVEAYYNLGNVYAKLGRFQEAIKSYQTAIKYDPTHENALANLDILVNYIKSMDKSGQEENK
ncbi:hypothetical protein MNBD_UNCLBAC01-1006 [hydrothermal vent metagenome]|uniref:Uncharacterized protein n=1 Tax=hydrothermal vent metagenome TaxID=652676 RepID=A0A3B1DW71_9ZZZZ